MIFYAIKNGDNLYYSEMGRFEKGLNNAVFWDDLNELEQRRNRADIYDFHSTILYGKVVKVKIEELEEV